MGICIQYNTLGCLSASWFSLYLYGGKALIEVAVLADGLNSSDLLIIWGDTFNIYCANQKTSHHKDGINSSTEKQKLTLEAVTIHPSIFSL